MEKKDSKVCQTDTIRDNRERGQMENRQMNADRQRDWSTRTNRQGDGLLKTRIQNRQENKNRQGVQKQVG
jgi:hypothetical protein